MFHFTEDDNSFFGGGLVIKFFLLSRLTNVLVLHLCNTYEDLKSHVVLCPQGADNQQVDKT